VGRDVSGVLHGRRAVQVMGAAGVLSGAVTYLLPGHASVSSWLRWQRYHGITRCGILLPQVSHNTSDVESEGSGVSPSGGADVLDDFIEEVVVREVIRLDHGQSSNNSSGVQITGASTPAAAQTSAMRFRIAAFAMCRQFQVRRNSITQREVFRSSSQRSALSREPASRASSVPGAPPGSSTAAPWEPVMWQPVLREHR
jgi:hypothetical protein